MREILTIALNDIRNTFAERGVLVSMFIVPVVMTTVLGFVIGGARGVNYAIDVMVDPKAGALAETFMAQVAQAETGAVQFTLCDLSKPAQAPNACGLRDKTIPDDVRAFATERVKNGTTLSTLIVPANFTDDVMAGKSVSLETINRSGLTAPTFFADKINRVLIRLNGAISAARVATEKKNPPDADRAGFYDRVFTAANDIWAGEPVVINETNSAGENVGNWSNGFGQSSPGMGAMFVLMNALGLAAVFLTERQNGVTSRMMVMPVRKWQLLAGKLLGRFVLCVMVFAVMVGLGTIFGVRWGNPPGVVAIVLMYCLAVTALALAFSTLVRTQGQAAGITLLMALTLAPLSGAWWPLNFVPDWMRTLAQISPIYWSQEAFHRLIYYNGTLVDILPQLGVLLVFAAVLFAFGLARYRYE